MRPPSWKVRTSRGGYGSRLRLIASAAWRFLWWTAGGRLVDHGSGAASWRGSSSICPSRSWKHDTGRHGMPRRRGTTKRSGCWRRGGPSSRSPRCWPSCRAGWKNWRRATTPSARRRSATSGGGMAAPPRLLTEDVLSALSERVRMPPEDGGVWSGPKVAVWMARRLGLAQVHPQRGWEALRRIGWSIQRRGRGMRGRRPPRSRRPLKGGRSGGRAGQGGTSWPSRRGLGRGRAPPRPEADPAPGLGAGRPAADRPRPPSVPVAARGRLRPADQRRDGVVSRDRPVEALLRGPARRLRPADRRGPEAPHHPGARQCRLASPRRFGRPRGDRAWRSCRPTLRSCSRPSIFLSTRTSPRWMRSMPPSPNAAAVSTPAPSSRTPISIGGRGRRSRADQPELVRQAGAEDRRRGRADDGGRARHGGGRQRGRPHGLPARSPLRLIGRVIGTTARPGHTSFRARHRLLKDTRSFPGTLCLDRNGN